MKTIIIGLALFVILAVCSSLISSVNSTTESKTAEEFNTSFSIDKDYMIESIDVL